MVNYPWALHCREGKAEGMLPYLTVTVKALLWLFALSYIRQRKEEKKMKRIISLTVLLLIILSSCLTVSCGGDDSDEVMMYTEDTTLGSGATQFTLAVEHADGKRVVFTINTDKTVLSDALTEHNLLEGDEGEFGLYVKKVNGITADYDKDKTYWALYIDGEYAMSGVDSTPITAGEEYTFKVTK